MLGPQQVQWTLSTLAQVMACCLTAPSHYMNQSFLVIRGGLTAFKITATFPRGQWVNNTCVLFPRRLSKVIVTWSRPVVSWRVMSSGSCVRLRRPARSSYLGSVIYYSVTTPHITSLTGCSAHRRHSLSPSMVSVPVQLFAGQMAASIMDLLPDM